VRKKKGERKQGQGDREGQGTASHKKGERRAQGGERGGEKETRPFNSIEKKTSISAERETKFPDGLRTILRARGREKKKGGRNNITGALGKKKKKKGTYLCTCGDDGLQLEETKGKKKKKHRESSAGYEKRSCPSMEKKKDEPGHLGRTEKGGKKKEHGLYVDWLEGRNLDTNRKKKTKTSREGPSSACPGGKKKKKKVTESTQTIERRKPHFLPRRNARGLRRKEGKGKYRQATYPLDAQKKKPYMIRQKKKEDGPYKTSTAHKKKKRQKKELFVAKKHPVHGRQGSYN